MSEPSLEFLNFQYSKLKGDKAELEDELATLKSGGGGGTSDGMDTVDAKIAAAEARTDTKFAELRGDLKDFATKGDLHKTVWGATAVIVATILALASFGGGRFDAGLGMADQRQAQLARDEQQDVTVTGINTKLDKLIEQTAKK